MARGTYNWSAPKTIMVHGGSVILIPQIIISLVMSSVADIDEIERKRAGFLLDMVTIYRTSIRLYGFISKLIMSQA